MSNFNVIKLAKQQYALENLIKARIALKPIFHISADRERIARLTPLTDILLIKQKSILKGASHFPSAAQNFTGQKEKDKPLLDQFLVELEKLRNKPLNWRNKKNFTAK